MTVAAIGSGKAVPGKPGAAFFSSKGRQGRGLRVIVGVDTGGTFTDLVAFVGGVRLVHKVPSTPAAPEMAVLRGLRELLPGCGAMVVTYGSTVATNALLERRGARVVLLTTAGFEDVIEIGRQNRPVLYTLEPARAAALVERSARVGVRERLGPDGAVVEALRPGAVAAAVRAASRRRPEAVAICLLHAYANPSHERRLGAAVREALPGVFTSLSHELVAAHREYERCSTAVVNAYVGPVMQRHLGRLAAGVPGGRLRVMQSNGGAIAAELAGREAVRTVLSGPAAGVGGAWRVALQLGLRRVITFDMGGTSTDVSLLDGGIGHRTAGEIGGLPVEVPAIDIHTVGAGGGSLAVLDAGGALKVGPESAGADPGPACYGRGTRPTVTDANVVLGRLVPDAFLGGRMRLDGARAGAALRPLARALNASVEAAADGVVRVVNASMERAIRAISVERGHDPRAYVLMAFGGAAGQHACALAMALGIRRVVVPESPGLLSAWGAATADVQRDFVRTVRLVDPSSARLEAVFGPLERAAAAALRQEGFGPGQCSLRRIADLCYVGQSHEIQLPLSRRLPAVFHAMHRRLYGYADPGRSVQVVNVRVMGIGRGVRVRERPRAAPEPGVAAPWGLHWDARRVRGRVWDRAALPVGADVRGPAVIVELSGTTVVPPGWRAQVHRTRHLVLRHGD